jgi:hypothetical protein
MPKMNILIDNEKVVEVEYEKVTADGDEYIVLEVEAVYEMLNAWRELDPRRRSFSWPAKRDAEDMMVAWYGSRAGLTTGWVSPFWDGHDDLDAHSLEAITDVMPADALQWGEKIGEPAP